MGKITETMVQDYFGNKALRKNDNLPILLKGDRKMLGYFLGEHDLNRGVEIGVAWGYNSKSLCQGNPNIELYCVDPWGTRPRAQQKLRSATRRLKHYNATIMKMTSLEALVKFEDHSLDFVYIDGNHTFDFVMTDIIQWSYKVKPGGIIACHDYYNFRKGAVVKAIDAYTHCHSIDPWFVTYEIMPTAFWFNRNTKGGPKFT